MSIGPSVLNQRLRHFLQPKRVAFLEACLIGLVSGLAAVILQQGIGSLGSWRLYLTTLAPAWIILPLFGLIGGLLAGGVISYLAPSANGSGISQVKMALAQLPMPLNLRVAIAKLISTIFSVGSGLMLGRQGPTVQVGAALAAQLSYWWPTVPDQRRQMIAAGAGAGLAAGFNAPIAGVLFVVEELLQDLSGLTLGTAIISSFIGAVIARVLGGQSFVLGLDEIAVGTSFSVPEIPFYILLGALAGLLGGLFNRGLMLPVQLPGKFKNISLALRIGIAGLVCGSVLALLPDIFRNNAGLRELINYSSISWQLVAIAFIVQFGLSILSYQSDAPGGVFAPSLVLGAALGHLVGLLEGQILGAGEIVTYSLVGMGAFFGAVSRVPMTGIVIIFEMTTDFNLVLPLMICGVVSHFVADRVSPGSIYNRLLEEQGEDLARSKPSRGILDTLTAAEMMQRRVETLASELPIREARDAFSRSHHRGFPVVEKGRLVGIITRSDLTQKARDQQNDDTPLRTIMTSSPITVLPEAKLTEVLYLLNHYSLSRLPVVEGRKLVGIITRADIIRAESAHLSGQELRLKNRAAPAYVVYQTRSPATGVGRMLVPLSNPQTAELLLKLAVSIARARSYELECLQIITVPSDRIPSETPITIGRGRQLMELAQRMGKREDIIVHTQIKVAHDVARTILETEKERLIDMTLMGWEGRPAPADRIFGTVVDTIIRQAAGEVLLVKTGPQPQKKINRWMVPFAGGPNSELVLSLMPPFSTLCQQPKIEICQVFSARNSQTKRGANKALILATESLQQKTSSLVTARSLCADNVADAILELADSEAVDVIVLGASREGLLQQVLNGNIPERIARESHCTVIVVRGPNLEKLS